MDYINYNASFDKDGKIEITEDKKKKVFIKMKNKETGKIETIEKEVDKNTYEKLLEKEMEKKQEVITLLKF